MLRHRSRLPMWWMLCCVVLCNAVACDDDGDAERPGDGVEDSTDFVPDAPSDTGEPPDVDAGDLDVASDGTDTLDGMDAGDTDPGELGDVDASDQADMSPIEPQPLDPTTIPKFVTPLLVPPVMPWTSRTEARTEYVIAARQFEQQILPEGFAPPTTVWGYGPADGPASAFHSPSLTLEARVGERVRVTWRNELVDAQGRFLPHLLPVDQTLHWANPAGPIDSDPELPVPYLGPVPFVTHVHGAHTESISDGLPTAWYLPDAVDIPEGYTTRGSGYGSVIDAPEGAAVFEYPHDQRAATRWYHDHALGITRLNVYAGLAGFWLVRGGEEDTLELPGPAPALDELPGTLHYEIPLAIQDRSFHTDGSLRYPKSRAEFDGYTGPYEPDSEVPPIWVPEFFGDALVVNGHTWPYLEVEPRLYRLRLLNGCNARFLILALDPPLQMHQIGNEGGLLPDAPVAHDALLLGPAERADVLVDFSSLAPGSTVLLRNLGPDEPFKGLAASQPPADPETTGQVLQLRVVAPSGSGDAGEIPSALPPMDDLQTVLAPRDLLLGEEMDPVAEVPAEALLGTLDEGLLEFGDAVTERPRLGSTEIWRIANLTEDAHPVHLHLVEFQVLDRVALDAEAFAAAHEAWLDGQGERPSLDEHVLGAAVPPRPGERGRKDTAIMEPGMVTRIAATFDLAGFYVWHCHVLEHEDNSMMRPYEVVVPEP